MAGLPAPTSCCCCWRRGRVRGGGAPAGGGRRPAREVRRRGHEPGGGAGTGSTGHGGAGEHGARGSRGAQEAATDGPCPGPIWVVGIKYSDDLYGVRATINVYEPKVKKDSKDLSQSGVLIYNGPRDQKEGAGACYSIAPSFNGDSFARFHVTWRDAKLHKPCYDHTCPGFVQVSHRVDLGGRVLPISVYNGPQYVIDIFIFKDPKTANWWVMYGEEKASIGYWPSSLFSHIKENGNFSFWGGHVSGPTASSDSPQIGSGHFAYEGYEKATFVRNIQIVNNNNKLVTQNTHKYLPGTSDKRKYSIDGYDVDNHVMHMYYDGPGNLV
ncbi:uncharacterized protein LOC123428691 [Hordeum vulgare subsp. vulgare]|uniref:uncharacterized protein LOC123428691 n=1 Tax=Hordeum vulgare subsp. vulgare TaxID=112509 RepID=UPI001D1A491A|nr:uncharacterized protein LOC123428691 [Hordeum vulgare subsp. vulgare]